VKNQYNICLVIASLVLLTALYSCEYNVESELYPNSFCDTTRVANFSIGVRSVLAEHCDQCHSGADPVAGFVIDTYETLEPFVSNGSFLCSITHGDGCLPMPDDAPKILECDIDLVRDWINSGAQDD